MLNAFAFVNPRDDKEESNQNTFPSKLLEYISYGKPILSTFSNSLDEEFNNLLLLYNPYNLMSLKEQLNNIKLMNLNELIFHKKKLEIFTIKNSWKQKTNNLLIFLENYMLNSK